MPDKCGAKNKSGVGTCGMRPGWGTAHVGSGRCKLHGGASTGPKDLRNNRNAVRHGAYETLIREHLPEVEREAYDRVSVRTDLEAELRVNRFKMLRLMGEVEQNLVAGPNVKRIKADDLTKIDAIVKLSDNIRKIVKDMQGDDPETSKMVDSFMAGVHTVREMAAERDMSESAMESETS